MLSCSGSMIRKYAITNSPFCREQREGISRLFSWEASSEPCYLE
jgi:hypothetical protein